MAFMLSKNIFKCFLIDFIERGKEKDREKHR